MGGNQIRNRGKEARPLLAFSDLPNTENLRHNSVADDQMRTTPPWTPPATPEERADFFRNHETSSSSSSENETLEMRDRVALIRAELERKLAQQNRAGLHEQEWVEQSQEDVIDATSAEALLRMPNKEKPVPDENVAEEWKPLIDPRIVFQVINGSRKLLLATTLLGGVLAALYALSLPHFYVATTDILVDPRNIKAVGTELTPGPLPTDASLAIAESQARMIDSSSVLLKVIDQTDLIEDLEFNGTLAPVGLAAIIGQLREAFSKPSPTNEQALETRVLRNLRESLSINRDAKTFIYSISVKTLDPQKSAFLANTVSTVFQGELDSLNSDAARRNSEELAKQLIEMRTDVEDAEKTVADFRAAHDLIDVDGKLISDNELTRLNDQLTNQRTETLRLQARVQVLNNTSRDAVLSGTLPEDFRSNTLTALRGQYAAANQAANGLSTRLGPRHPQLVQLQSQAQALLRDVDAELRRIRTSMQVEVERSIQQERDLSIRLAQLKAQQANSNDDRVKLRELEREAETRRAVYEAFLLRMHETEKQEGITTTNIRVLSEARPPLDPAGPSRKFIAIAGLMLGLMVGLAISLVRNLTRIVRFS